MLHGDSHLDRELHSENRKSPVRLRTVLIVVAALLLALAVMALWTPPPAI